MLSPPQLYGIVGTLLKRHTSDDTFFAIMALVNAYVETVPFVASQVLEDGGHNAVRGALIWL